MTSVAGIAYGLDHAPQFTINALNGLLYAAATEYQTRVEDQIFAHQLAALMASCGPWQYGPETASQSRASPQLFTHAYRLHPSGVFALN
jgi:hypothetical protein